MSFQNRQEDINAILALKVDESYCFNMFQDGGCRVVKTGVIGQYQLWVIPLYGGIESYHKSYYVSEIKGRVDAVYSWT